MRSTRSEGAFVHCRRPPRSADARRPASVAARDAAQAQNLFDPSGNNGDRFSGSAFWSKVTEYMQMVPRRGGGRGRSRRRGRCVCVCRLRGLPLHWSSSGGSIREQEDSGPMWPGEPAPTGADLGSMPEYLEGGVGAHPEMCIQCGRAFHSDRGTDTPCRPQGVLGPRVTAALVRCAPFLGAGARSAAGWRPLMSPALL